MPNLFIIITNKTGTPMTGISASLAGLFEGIAVTQPYSPYPTGGSPLWRAVTNVSIVSGGRYHVTNDVPSTNVFYHLRKPVP